MSNVRERVENINAGDKNTSDKNTEPSKDTSIMQSTLKQMRELHGGNNSNIPNGFPDAQSLLGGERNNSMNSNNDSSPSTSSDFKHPDRPTNPSTTSKPEHHTQIHLGAGTAASVSGDCGVVQISPGHHGTNISITGANDCNLALKKSK